MDNLHTRSNGIYLFFFFICIQALRTCAKKDGKYLPPEWEILFYSWITYSRQVHIGRYLQNVLPKWNKDLRCWTWRQILTEELAQRRVHDVGHPLDDQQADEWHEQARHIAHDVVTVHVAKVRQHGVNDQRYGQAHYRRHGTEQDQHVLPAASGVVYRALVQQVVGGHAHVGNERRRSAVVAARRMVFQAVFALRHVPACVRQVERAVGQQFEITALVHVPVIARELAVVRQQHGLVGRTTVVVVGLLVDHRLQCPVAGLLALVAVCKRRRYYRYNRKSNNYQSYWLN